MQPAIIVNAARCVECGDTVVSRSVHDYVSCSCGNAFTDGGREYIRRGFRDSQPLDLTVTEADAELLGKFRAAGIWDALVEAGELLARGTDSDLRNGSRWKTLSPSKLWRSLADHFDEWQFDPQGRLLDSVTGFHVGAHVVARALMNRQREIDRDREDKIRESRKQNSRGES